MGKGRVPKNEGSVGKVQPVTSPQTPQKAGTVIRWGACWNLVNKLDLKSSALVLAGSSPAAPTNTGGVNAKLTSKKGSTKEDYYPA